MAEKHATPQYILTRTARFPLFVMPHAATPVRIQDRNAQPVCCEEGACVASGGVKSDVLEKSLAATSVQDRERHMTERTVI